MKFIDNNIQDYTGTDFNVFKNPDGVTIMKFNDTQQWLSNMEQYGNLFLGGCDSCSSFYKDSFDGFSYDSVLVAGLGFGLIPQELINLSIQNDEPRDNFMICSAHLAQELKKLN